MKNYAMILIDRVIYVVKDSNTVPNWPPDPEGNPVFTIECDSTVEIGMAYKGGKFVPYTEPVEIYKPTDGELLLMKSQAAMYEEMQANRLSQMKANADIYEAILSNGGNI